MSRRGAILFALMSVLWGIPYVLIKVAVRSLSPALIVEGRTLIAAVVLLPLVGREPGEVRRLMVAWRPLLAYTAAELGVAWWLLSDAERRLPSSLTGLLVAAVPIVATVLAPAFGTRDGVGARTVAGLVVGLVGVGVLLGLDVGRGDLGAVGMIALVVLCYATGPQIASRWLSGYSSLALAWVSLLLIALVYLPPALTELPRRVPPGRVIAAVVVLGVVCTALAFVAFFELIKEIGSTRATVITYVNPAVAVMVGVAFLGERFTAATGAGFALILAGSITSTRRRAEAVPTAGPVPEVVGGADPEVR